MTTDNALMPSGSKIDIIEAIDNEVDYLKQLSESFPSRALSLAITNIENAGLWATKIPVKE